MEQTTMEKKWRREKLEYLNQNRDPNLGLGSSPFRHNSFCPMSNEDDYNE